MTRCSDDIIVLWCRDVKCAVSPACSLNPEIAPLSPDAEELCGLCQHHKYNLNLASEELLAPSVHLSYITIFLTIFLSWSGAVILGKKTTTTTYCRWFIESRRLLKDLQGHRCFLQYLCVVVWTIFPIYVVCHAGDRRIKSQCCSYWEFLWMAASGNYSEM